MLDLTGNEDRSRIKAVRVGESFSTPSGTRLQRGDSLIIACGSHEPEQGDLLLVLAGEGGSFRYIARVLKLQLDYTVERDGQEQQRKAVDLNKAANAATSVA